MAKQDTRKLWKDLLSDSRLYSEQQKWQLALKHAKQAWRIAKTFDKSEEKYETLLRVAQCSFDAGNSVLARKTIQDILSFMSSEDPEEKNAQVAAKCAELYLDMGLLNEARTILNERVFMCANTLKATVDALSLFGRIFLAEKEPNKALVYFKQAAHTAESMNLKENQIEEMWAMSLSYILIGNYVEGIQVLEDSYAKAQEYNLNLHAAASLAHLGQAYSDLGNLGLAGKYLYEALELSDELTPDTRVYVLERMFPKPDRSKMIYTNMITTADKYIKSSSKTGNNRILILHLRQKIIALNGLGRYEEVQEAFAEIVDLIGSSFDLHWPLLGSLMSELAIALYGLNRPENGKRAAEIAERLQNINSDSRLTKQRKNTRYQAISQEILNFIEYLETNRVNVFCIRGRVINFEKRSISGAGIDPPNILTRFEKTLLQYLIAHQGKVCEPIDVAASVYEGARNHPERNWRAKLKPHMSKIRKKLGDVDCSIIIPVRNKGWRLADD